MSIIVPNALRKDDFIGVVAPAVPLTAIAGDNVEIGIKNIESIGYRVKFANNIEIPLSDPLSARKRAEDIHDMFRDDSVGCVMALLGGYSSMELLDYMDFEFIKNHPKAFIGFSDITVLNMALKEKAGLMNFYGPTFAIFCEKNLPEYTKKYFLEMLTQNREVTVEVSERYADDLWYNNNDGNRCWKKNPGMRIVRNHAFAGECVGGNLDTLLALAGTAYWPDFSGKVLFVEEGNNVSVEEIRRKIMQLKLLGVFDEIKGLVFGRFWSWTSEKTDGLFKYLSATVFGDYGFGIVADMDFGHSDPMFTIPEGGYMEFDGKGIRISK